VVTTLPVDVGQECLERVHPLGHAALDQRPLLGADHPRHDVQREGLLLTGVREGDPGVAVGLGEDVGPGGQLLPRHRLQRAVQPGVGRARLGGRREHLVPLLPEGVAVEEVRHATNLGRACV
jgi:hypothetical protein